MPSSLRSKLSVFVQRRLQAERRRGKRVVPAHRTLCLLRMPGEDDSVTALVQNLSSHGIGVLADREYPVGAPLHLLLVNHSHIFSVALDLNVIRCLRTANNQYYLAGPFSRALTHEEMVPFII
jgi:hypothetical protein